MFFKQLRVVNCGIAGNRTRVQTGKRRAFYTLSFRLDFRDLARPETATRSLASVFSGLPRSEETPRFAFTVPLNKTPHTKASQENLAFLPCRNEANLTLIQIMQQERSYFRRLKVRNNDVREQFHFPACLLSGSACCQNQSTPFKFLYAFVQK